MKDSELKEYEDKLLNLIESLKVSENLLDKTWDVIDHASLESVLRKTNEKKILEQFAYECIYGDTTEVHLAEEIALNVNTPDFILNKLSQKGGYVETAVARNSSTSIETLLCLAKYSTDTDTVSYSKHRLRERRVVLRVDGRTSKF